MHIGITAALTDRTAAPHVVALAAEERGFYSFYLPEHTHMPLRESTPPAPAGVDLDAYRRSLDPMVALAACAVVTERIRLGTGIALVAQHDPIVLAKQVATLDRLAGGRFVLGCGFGWNRAEAADHGVEFGERHAVTREKLLCMQALWAHDEAEFHGRYVDLPLTYSWPKPVQQPRVRTLIGGGAGPMVFAAVAEYADGWMPVGGAGVARALPELRRAMTAAGREPASLHVVTFGSVPDRGKLEHYMASGVTEVVLRVGSGSESTMLSTLDDYTRFLEG